MNGFTREDLDRALSALGEVLASRGSHYELVLVGGGNLLLRGVIKRTTRDADVLGEVVAGHVRRLEVFPDDLRVAVEDVARAYQLDAGWLNLGPQDLLELGLPVGFEGRLERVDHVGLVIWFAGRYDLICFKLFAAADHWPTESRHIQDLRALGPTTEELLSAAAWARTQDGSPDFRSLLVNVLVRLGMEDADVVLG